MFSSIFYIAWLRLLRTYIIAFGTSFIVGLVLIHFIGVPPEKIFEASSTRLSYVVPMFDAGVSLGIDQGIVIFLWNTGGALVTMSFFYMFPLFNPERRNEAPRWLRSLLCGNHRMRLLCYLPGCRRIHDESLRRLYVWLMIPLLGMVLLGVESGLLVATGNEVFGSYVKSFLALLPHGIVEIPAITLAGAVTFSGHLLMKANVPVLEVNQLFRIIEEHKQKLPFKAIVALVVLGLLIAGILEAHLTPKVMAWAGS